MTQRKKLIEVALPLEAISREASREKGIRLGHPSTFHLWWARRPLTACRAVIFATLVDDPSSDPDRFPTEELQDTERLRLFAILEALATWGNSTSERVLGAARAEIARSCGGEMPAVLDPFCGGGSIPLEAQRLGLEAYGTDLNPVATLITRGLVEIPPKFSNMSPVNPEGVAQQLRTWSGAQGLADDVRYFGRWMRDSAERRIGTHYPSVALPPANGAGDATVISWIWARTVKCPNPACGLTMPLLNSLAICSKKGKEAWLRPAPDRAAGITRFELQFGPGYPPGGSITRTGATCLACGTSVPLPYVRTEAVAGRMRAQLVCIIADGGRRRLYLPATDDHINAADVDAPTGILDTKLPDDALGFRVQGYGIKSHRQLFTPRQLLALKTFSDLVGEAREAVLETGATPEYADAITTYLGLCVSRLANRTSTQCFWDPGGETVQQVFARNAMPMMWAYAEGNPFSDSSGNFLGQVDYLAEALAKVPAAGVAHVYQSDAGGGDTWPTAVVITDPPYYDNVPFADLSDFFYVWLRLTLRDIHPDLFGTLLVPKQAELIAEPARHQGGRIEAANFFEEGLRRAFSKMLKAQAPGYPMAIFYAFKQAEDSGDGKAHASTGWETMLQGLLDAGCEITGTWPVRTEQSGGLREVGRNALASSIVLACRPRQTQAALASRREFVAAMKKELPNAVRRLQQGNIAPVDLAQASIGPGMSVFSRYAKVIEADGSSMTVRTALALINQSLDETLSEQEGDFDPDTRWAVAWFEQNAMNPGPFGVAETLSKAKNTAVNALVQAGIVESKGGKVKLIDRAELDPDWNPTTDRRLTTWEVTQHLVTALETSEIDAASLLREVGGVGETARELAYRLFSICEKKKWSGEASAYNALVVAWPEIARLARGSAPPGQQWMEL